MKYTRTFFFLAALLTAYGASAEDAPPEIDEQEGATLTNDRAECKTLHFNVMRQMNCVSERRDARAAKGLLRGTKEYCQKHYIPLKTNEITNKLNELDQRRKTAKDPLRSQNTKPGEVDVHDYNREIRCIISELKKRNALGSNNSHNSPSGQTYYSSPR